MDINDNDNIDDKGISALGLDSKGQLIIKFTIYKFISSYFEIFKKWYMFMTNTSRAKCVWCEPFSK